MRGMRLRSEHFTTDLIQRIRARQEEYPELKQSHHFVFDCPLDPSYKGPTEFVWLGLNPGSDDEDWERHGVNTEETRQYNYQVEFGRSTASATRMRRLYNFLGAEMFSRTTHSQLFFWCSRDTNEAFKERFGYRFRDNPHWTFCCETNVALIERIRPKAVMAESRPTLALYERDFGLLPVKTHRSEVGDALIEERRFANGVPFYCFDHLSARRGHANVRAKLKELLRR